MDPGRLEGEQVAVQGGTAGEVTQGSGCVSLLRDHLCVCQGHHSTLLLPMEPPAQGEGRC